MNRHQLRRAVRCLREGGIVAYPTEAVWGLGCDPGNAAAVQRLLELKHRPADKGLILIAHDFGALRPYLIPLDHSLLRKVKRSWPGPVTWLLPAAARTSALLRGKSPALAVRVTAHPLAAALCRAFGGAIVSTSANPATRRPARNAQQVRRYFGHSVFVLSGETGGRARPTEIRDGATGAIIRRA
jgi:L-threonylcarbamoyladenylate synthase